jgi:hypothetical protein
MNSEVDIFLSYHSSGVEQAMALATILKDKQIKTWIAEPEILGGAAWMEAVERAIRGSRSAGIILGPQGIGDWQKVEIEVCIQESMRRKDSSYPVIPILLPGTEEIELPPFLARFSIVDFRRGFSDDRAMTKLIWSITATIASEATAALVATKPDASLAQASDKPVDSYAVAVLKHRLHTASEVIAMEGANNALYAAQTCSDPFVSKVIPLAFNLRWGRAYFTAFELLFRQVPVECHLSDCDCEEVWPPGGATDGVLSATMEGRDVLIFLDDCPAVRVKDLPGMANAQPFYRRWWISASQSGPRF